MEPREDILSNINKYISRLFWLRKNVIDDETIEVVWDDRETNKVGGVVFKKAKNIWNNKPIINSSYVISDADLFKVLDILHRYVDFNENEYSEIRKILELNSKNALKK